MDSKPKSVTMGHLESLVATEEYLRPETAKTLTICVLTLKNGFSLVGESACADPANYSRILGEKLARANALNKAWPLEGYLLRQQLHDAE